MWKLMDRCIKNVCIWLCGHKNYIFYELIYTTNIPILSKKISYYKFYKTSRNYVVYTTYTKYLRLTDNDIQRSA